MDNKGLVADIDSRKEAINLHRPLTQGEVELVLPYDANPCSIRNFVMYQNVLSYYDCIVQ